VAESVAGLALGGVGGFNAHDAGVLKAFADRGVAPDVITCTSGAIFWTYQYLTDPDGIPDEVRRQADRVRGSNAVWTAITGVPGVFSPAYAEYVRRWFTPWRRLSPRELANRLLPAQVYRPTRPAADFAAMAAAFNASPIPIVFNAYDISEGEELLFGNPPAMEFLQAQDAAPHLVAGRDVPSHYRPIDAAAVESALWLVLYGFDHRYEGAVVIDGAYHRQLIIAELTSCTVIYAVKPQNDAWRADPPANYFEVQDFNTEMWFNSSYAAEVAALRSAQPSLQIVPITMDHPLGYWNYFVEKTRNYVAAYEAATALLHKPDSPFRAVR
jgi:predicted acylesterase/phospholipase RssA